MLDERAWNRLLEAIIPWVAGRKPTFLEGLPEAVTSACLEWADETSEQRVLIAFGELCVVADGQLGLFVLPGKAEIAEAYLTQYLFADRSGVTVSLVSPDIVGFAQSEPPVYWLDAEPGKEVVATLAFVRGQ